MKAMAIAGFGEPPTAIDVPEPAPGDGEVVVRVHGSSVNPVDRAIASGMFAELFEHEFPVILGRDFAGVVEQAGPGVTRFAEGDEVFGFLMPATPAVHDGAWRELIAVAQDGCIAAKPEGVAVEVAGAVPLAGLTALQSLAALGLASGDSLLIVGATGGVGSLAAQLAARAGVIVVAPAWPEDGDYLRELGVAELLDRDADLAAVVRARHPDGIDALLDLVSFTAEDFAARAAALRPGGRAASPLSVAGDGPGRANIVAVPTPENAERLAGLLAAGTLRVPIQRSYGLDEAADALADLSTTHKHGKLAIRFI